MASEDFHKSYLNKEIDLAEWRSNFYKQIMHELQTEERYVNYFSQYEPASVKQFMERYANIKINWYEHGNSFAEHARKHNEHAYDESVKALILIQKKKLFNLACQWGLGEIKLPDIEVSEELFIWQFKIFDCPYLASLTQQDIEDYITFLHESDPDENRSDTNENQLYSINFEGRQSKEDWLDDDRYCPWFLWHDEHYGNLRFIQQPITRIVKEWEYRRIHQREENKGKNVDTSVQPSLPNAYFYYLKDELIAKHEDAAFREMYHAMEQWKDQNEFVEEIEMDIIELSKTKQWVPVNAHDDWRTAIARANEQHKRTMLAQELGYVFEEYLEMKETGKGFKKWYKPKKDWHILFEPEDYKKTILQGRVLSGEAADFNF